MPSKEQFAAAAVATGRAMVHAAKKYGVDSEMAKQAARLADRALTDAEAAGCTAADYARARRTAH
ncbi:hypothetical protein LUX12_12460 [Streptomyces somaliensis]|uniref:hypothetical protein n=1 Tax=Streptomyces somaliensis TaxID=78355 RepID=UPI0020CC5D3C|nr:hypothetical protein [Streptomyces somaliensis]MCP9945420.1 hypothetical protein [Streptomyces somaliensis]MCP9961381.1 hypothetical protein [Streptomyces somaliensis]MCP9974188.1 hypothetical protein [Streptomyces somaliensis]